MSAVLGDVTEALGQFGRRLSHQFGIGIAVDEASSPSGPSTAPQPLEMPKLHVEDEEIAPRSADTGDLTA